MPNEPLTVTAHLATAYSTSDPWSPDLSAILAYWALREQLGEEEFALGMSGHRPLVEPDLPLARETFDGDWWWQCSSPLATIAATGTRHVHRRFDDQFAVDRVPESVRTVLTAGGPYKIYRTPHTLFAARLLVWRCIGDADAIRRLLRRCGNVGYGHTKGYGQVSRWEVGPAGDEWLARFHRPLPVAFAEVNGIEGMRLSWGIRPPGRHPDHQRLCVMPEARRGDD